MVLLKTKSQKPRLLPTKVGGHFGDPNANLPIKTLNKVAYSKLDSIKFLREASYAGSGGTNERQYLASVKKSGNSKYLASLKMTAHLGLVQIQIYIFKYPFEPEPKYQIVTFE
jgi:hypothetical protein